MMKYSIDSEIAAMAARRMVGRGRGLRLDVHDGFLIARSSSPDVDARTPGEPPGMR